MNHCI